MTGLCLELSKHLFPAFFVPVKVDDSDGGIMRTGIK